MGRASWLRNLILSALAMMKYVPLSNMSWFGVLFYLLVFAGFSGALFVRRDLGVLVLMRRVSLRYVSGRPAR